MGDPTQNADKVLTQAPLQNRTRILSIEDIPTRGELSTAARNDILQGKALQGQGDLLAPYDPEDKIVWAIKKAFAQEVTNQRRVGLDQALAALEQDKAKFLGGVVVGIGKAALDVAESYVVNAKDAISGVLQFYTLVYDIQVWVDMLAVWLGGSSDEMGQFKDYLQQNYPGLWSAISTYPKVTLTVQKLFAGLGDGKAFADLCVKLVDALVPILTFDKERNKDRIDEFIGLSGNAYDQGVLIGETVGVAVIQAILFIHDMYALVRSTLRLGQQLVTKYVEAAKEFTKLLEAYPDLKELARLKAAQETAQNLYFELSTEIKPYRELNKRTGLFNQNVAILTGRQSREFIGLRLDADHILEDRTFSWFEKEFQALGWKTAKDMDAMAVHTEFHIRSGSGLTDVFDIKDETLVGERSLTYLKIEFIGKDPTKYPHILDLVDAYEKFYQTKAPLYYPYSSQWFIDLKAKIKTLGL